MEPIAAIAPSGEEFLLPRPTVGGSLASSGFSWRQVGIVAATVLAALSAAFLADLLVFSRMEHSAYQHRMFTVFRNNLAEGVAPVSQVDINGHLLRPGTPVALLQIPSLGVSEVVGEGTSSEQLTHGPGHLRTTVLPGEAGDSVIFGRETAFGGPFGGISGLLKGEKIQITDGIGQIVYQVIDVRRKGDPIPPVLAAGAGRLTLLTATGGDFDPTGVIRVDAEQVSPQQATAVTLASVNLSAAELPMAGSTSTLWELVMWLQALLVMSVLGTVSWFRWGHIQTLVAGLPGVLLVGFFVSDQIIRLMPNMM